MTKDKKSTFSLATIKKSFPDSNFLSEIQQELVTDEQNTLKDFVKGAYRFALEKEKQIEILQKQVDTIKTAIEVASDGKWEDLAKIKIPARFFDESTLRKHGKTLIAGNDEIRFVDLYSIEEDEEE